MFTSKEDLRSRKMINHQKMVRLWISSMHSNKHTLMPKTLMLINLSPKLTQRRPLIRVKMTYSKISLNSSKWPILRVKILTRNNYLQRWSDGKEQFSNQFLIKIILIGCNQHILPPNLRSRKKMVLIQLTLEEIVKTLN